MTEQINPPVLLRECTELVTPTSIEQYTPVTPQPQPFQCAKCGAQYKQKESLYRHNKISHYPEDISIIKSDGWLNKYPLQSTGPYPDVSHLHAIRPFQCPECNNCYKHIQGLHTHVRSRHQPNNGKLNCQFCLRNFDKQWMLTAHIQRSHEYETDLPSVGNGTTMQATRMDEKESEPMYFDTPSDSEQLFLSECLKEIASMFRMWKSK